MQNIMGDDDDDDDDNDDDNDDDDDDDDDDDVDDDDDDDDDDCGFSGSTASQHLPNFHYLFLHQVFDPLRFASFSCTL